MKVKKAIITAAGVGTRMLPATKDIQKELIPILNKPLIHYVVMQCLDAGIKEVIIVTNGDKQIEEYFKENLYINKYLAEKGKESFLDEWKKLKTNLKFIFIKQDETLPYGNAAPIYSARELIDNGEPFIYSWGDVFIHGENKGIIELINYYEDNKSDIVLTCLEVPKDRVNKHGIVSLEGEKVVDIIEKPEISTAPSNIASVAPYLFTSKIFDYLKPKVNGRVKEFLVQDAIEDSIGNGDIVNAVISSGNHITNGDPLKIVLGTIELAMSDDELREKVLDYIQQFTR